MSDNHIDGHQALDELLLSNIKREMINRKVNGLRRRYIMGHLTAREAGQEIVAYMNKLEKLDTLEKLDAWRKG